jgi:hypothetical protein
LEDLEEAGYTAAEKFLSNGGRELIDQLKA